MECSVVGRAFLFLSIFVVINPGKIYPLLLSKAALLIA